jgi:hypothetical protein
LDPQYFPFINKAHPFLPFLSFILASTFFHHSLCLILHRMHQSSSDTTSMLKSSSTITTIVIKRRSLGSLKKSLQHKQHTSPTNKVSLEDRPNAVHSYRIFAAQLNRQLVCF